MSRYILGMPGLNPAASFRNHLSAEVAWYWIHQVQVIQEVLLECV